MSWEDSGAIVIDVTGDGEDRIFLGLRSPVTFRGVMLAQSLEDGPVPGHTHIVSIRTSHKGFKGVR